MSTLESRYRHALGWYPATWRSLNADVVVGTLLDEAEATGRSTPRLAEIVNLRVNGLLTRIGHVSSVSQRLRDQLASLALGSGFALMAIMLLGYEWAPFASERYWPAVFGPFLSAAVIINLLWVTAFGFAVAGVLRWAKGVLVLSAVASVGAVLLVNDSPLLYARPPASALALLIVLAVVAIAGRPSRGSLTLSAGVSAALFCSLVVVQYLGNKWSFSGFLGWGWQIAASGWAAIALFLLAVVLVAVRRPEWVASITAFAVIWSIYSMGTAYTNHSDLSVFAGLLGTLTAVVAIAVASARLSGYRLKLVRETRT